MPNETAHAELHGIAAGGRAMSPIWRQLNKIGCTARGPGGVRPGHGTCHRLDEVRSCLTSAITAKIVNDGYVPGIPAGSEPPIFRESVNSVRRESAPPSRRSRKWSAP